VQGEPILAEKDCRGALLTLAETFA
jgi:hypothetical protein